MWLNNTLRSPQIRGKFGTPVLDQALQEDMRPTSEKLSRDSSQFLYLVRRERRKPLVFTLNYDVFQQIIFFDQKVQVDLSNQLVTSNNRVVVLTSI